MARSVVLRPAPRCPDCRLTMRWCTCAARRPLASPLRIDVLSHYLEAYRPSSTGHVIRRVFPDAGLHLFRPERPPDRTAVAVSGRELWVLHPDGEAMPPGADPAGVQLLLLDGTWAQSMARARLAGGWGRRVRLPRPGTSRYWLRTAGWPGRLSTAEALAGALAVLGCPAAAAELLGQFELHVLAHLAARGHRREAMEVLAGSTVRAEFPDLVARLIPAHWTEEAGAATDAGGQPGGGHAAPRSSGGSCVGSDG